MSLVAVISMYVAVTVLGLRKPVLSTQNTPIRIMVSISFCVCYTKSVSFIEFLRKSCEFVLEYYFRIKVIKTKN